MLSNILKSGFWQNDIVVLAIVFAFFYLYGLYLGRHRVISFILAFYPARFLYGICPFTSDLMFLKGDSLLLLNKVILFLIFLIPLDILISRYIFSESTYGEAKFFRIGGFAIASVILVLVFSYSFVSLDSVHKFSPMIELLFNGSYRLFWWSIAPLAILFVL